MAPPNNLRFIINTIPVDAVIFIFRLGTHTHTKSDGDDDDGEGIHNKKSVSADCFSPEERKKERRRRR
jgi:hypothetical protein